MKEVLAVMTWQQRTWVRALAIVLLILCPPLFLQGQTINTYAGNGSPGYSGDGDYAIDARLWHPEGMTVDSQGNLYITDFHNDRLRKVDFSTGYISTVAGTGVREYSGDGGPAVNAGLRNPIFVTLDPDGNIYISEPHEIRRIDALSKIISTVAGTGNLGFGGSGGVATETDLNFPTGMAIDGNNLYFATDNHVIRHVDLSSGIIHTIAGTGTPGYGDGPALEASFYYPLGVALDGQNGLLIADNGNHRVRRLDLGSNVVTTFAGTGVEGYSGDGGPATAARLKWPVDVRVDGSGNVYILNDDRLSFVDVSTNKIITVAGNGLSEFSGDGGLALCAGLASPFGLALDDQRGFLYISEWSSNRVRRVDVPVSTTVAPKISTYAGNGFDGYSGDGGPAVNASLWNPEGMTVDGDGNLFITDYTGSRLRKVDYSTGLITTVAGTGVREYSGDGGPAVDAGLRYPIFVALDSNENIYISEPHEIRKIDSDGSISTFAGTGAAGFSGDGGAAELAEINDPVGLAFDSNDNLYFGTYGDGRIRRVDKSTGFIDTVVGNGDLGYGGDDGPGLSASLYYHLGIALAGDDVLYIAEDSGCRVRRWDIASDVVTTVAGNGTCGYSGDGGPAADAELAASDVTVDTKGNLYILDYQGRVRLVDMSTPDRIISTVVGNGSGVFSGDGGPAVCAGLASPFGLALDSQRGNLYISEWTGSRVRRVKVPSDADLDGTFDLEDPCPADPDDLCNFSASEAAEISSTDGGTLETEDGSANLAFDPGDLSSDTTISVTEASSESTSVDITLGETAGVGEAVSAYKFEPDGLVFDSPVTLTLTADVTLLTPEQRAALTLYLFEDTDDDGVEDTYVEISGTSCSVSEDPPGIFLATCTAEISHFSTYALVSPKDTDGDGIFDDFPPDFDPCPELAEGISSLFYTGSLLVPTDSTGTATLELAAELLDSSSVPVVNAPVLLSLTGSNGITLAECSAETGTSSCLVSGVPPDVYTVAVTYDGLAGCYAPSSDSALVVVFDPDVPRATGGGFILPDSESTVPAQTVADKANFGFVVYINKQSAADGNLEFQYKTAGINLKSQGMTWYTVSNNKAMFQGLATINGEGVYTFRVQATDGTKMGQPDHFDIVIWAGTDTEAAPAHRTKNDLAGGNIVVHRK